MSRADELARRLWAGEAGPALSLLAALLAPAEALYRVGIAARNRAYDGGLLSSHRAVVPVISVGNVAVGGTGKTPFTHWLAVRLRDRGRRPAVLHGGYAHDEPALHRRWAPDIPVVVERDRVAGAARAVAQGADVIVLDDAFQHRRLRRDLDIVLIAAESWPGRRRLLPRGPLREPDSALRRADLLVVTRRTADAGAARDVASTLATRTGLPVATVHLHAAGWRRTRDTAGEAAAPPPGPAVLVSGIARPELFARNATDAGARIAAELTFRDHHAFDAADAERILGTAAGRPIVTTEKDWTRLEPRLGDADVWLLVQRIIVEHGADLLDQQLDRVLA